MEERIMDQVGALLDRPKFYYNIDGLGELSGGLMFLGIALLLSLPADSVWHKISWFILLGLTLAIPHGIKAIKTHITYPRTGFVEYRKSDRRRTSVIGGMAGALIPLGLFVAMRHRWEIATLASLAGLILAAAYAYRVARAVRWKWIVACAIALGSIVIGFLPADVLAAMANDSLVTHPLRARLGGTIVVSFIAYGAMLMISGGISLWLYLRNTHPQAQEEQ
jgi:hypothetical protein